MVWLGMKMRLPMKSGAMTYLPSSFAFSSLTALEILCQIRYLLQLQFSPFVVLTSFQVIAPVRETVSQTLASLLIHMPRRSLLHVHSVLLQMIRQDFNLPVNGKLKTEPVERNHVWEVRHAGLLGIKYEVAVRHDMFEAELKTEESGDASQNVLQDVVDAAILGCVEG
jgi:TATA-binding protein-associated factor